MPLDQGSNETSGSLAQCPLLQACYGPGASEAALEIAGACPGVSVGGRTAMLGPRCSRRAAGYPRQGNWNLTGKVPDQSGGPPPDTGKKRTAVDKDGIPQKRAVTEQLVGERQVPCSSGQLGPNPALLVGRYRTACRVSGACF